MKNMSCLKSIFVGLSLVLSLGACFADSPLTSTDFYKAYEYDFEIVKQAAEERALSDKFADYLSDPLNPLEVKAAIINALSWGDIKKMPVYQTYLAHKYNKPFRKIALGELHPHEVFNLGFFQAQDDYFHPDKSLPYFEHAQKRMPKSFTTEMVYSLARAQQKFEGNWCGVWGEPTQVLLNKKYTEDKLSRQAVNKIFEYMDSYRQYCVGEN